MDTEYPYSYTFAQGHPRRLDPLGRRWSWLCEHIGEMDCDWYMVLPFEYGEDLVYRFKTQEDLTLFVLTWA